MTRCHDVTRHRVTFVTQSRHAPVTRANVRGATSFNSFVIWAVWPCSRVVSGVKSYFSISQPRWAGGHGAGMIIIMDLNRYTSTAVMYSWMVTTMAKIHNGYHTFIKFSSWSLPWLRHCVQLLRLILQQRCKPRIPATLAACAASPLLSPETNLPIQIPMLGPTIALMEPLIILSLHHEHLPRVTPTNQPTWIKITKPKQICSSGHGFARILLGISHLYILGEGSFVIVPWKWMLAI